MTDAHSNPAPTAAPTVKQNPGFEILYWIGCAGSYDRRAQRVARAMVKLLHVAGVNFAILGTEEKCTGDSARRLGDEFLFQELAEANIATLQKHQVRRIVAHCPHCVNVFLKDYPQFGGHFEVLHHTQLLSQLLREGRLKITGEIPESLRQPATYHDPCYLARVNGIHDEPRDVLQQALNHSSSAWGVGADFGSAPLSPGGRGAGGEGDVMDVEDAIRSPAAVSSPSSGRSGHLLPPGEKGKQSKATAPSAGLREMSRCREKTSCCGAGGGRMWMEEPPQQRVSSARAAEALATGAQTVAVGCPFCLTMLTDGIAANSGSARVLDVAEILAERLGLS